MTKYEEAHYEAIQWKSKFLCGERTEIEYGERTKATLNGITGSVSFASTREIEIDSEKYTRVIKYRMEIYFGAAISVKPIKIYDTRVEKWKMF